MQLGLGLGLTRIGGGSSLARLLFSANEPGFTFEPWDITTLFQDRAGTTPVTAAGQSVGYRRDKSGRGNHQVAINDAARGKYGWMPKTGRRNLLNATDALSTQSVTVTAVAHTLAFTGTGTVTLSGVSTAGPLIGTGASNRVTLTFTPTAGSLTLTVSGSVTLAQLQVGSVDTAYQRVVSQYDITEAGVQTCYYIQADGVDDAYVTPTITPNTDKAQVFAGVRLSSVPSTSILAELSASGDANNGSFYQYFASATGAAIIPRIRGSLSIQSGPNPASITAPASSVYSSTYDLALAGNSITQRRNGAFDVTGGTVTQPGGNFLAYPAYIYARGGTSFPFNGFDFGHAVRFGPNLSAATIAQVERLIARNTPEVTL